MIQEIYFLLIGPYLPHFSTKGLTRISVRVTIQVMMNWKHIVVITLLLIGGLAAGLVYHFSDSVAPGGLKEISGQDLMTYIKEQKSPLVMVNFWASWCEPCKIEFPHIMKIRSLYQDKGLKVVFVSIDDVQDRQAAEEFLRAQGVDFTSFYKGKQTLKLVTDIYPNWTGSVPTTLLIGSDLKIVDAWEGDASFEEFEARIKRQLKGS